MELVSSASHHELTMRDIALAWKEDARLPIAAKRFMELIEERVSELL